MLNTLLLGIGFQLGSAAPVFASIAAANRRTTPPTLVGPPTYAYETEIVRGARLAPGFHAVSIAPVVTSKAARAYHVRTFHSCRGHAAWLRRFRR
jgi:hypothetical protein